MGTGQILLVIVGVAVLMVLFKFLFGTSARPRREASSSVRAVNANARRSVGAVAKQAILFADASMLLVNRAALQEDDPRINSALFIAGAVSYLAERAGLGDADRLAITGAVLKRAELMTDGEAYGFVADLLTLSASSSEGQLMSKGRETVHSWLSGRDDAAPAKLAQYVEEWATVQAGNI